MSDLGFLIFVFVGQVIPGVWIVAAFIWEIIKCAREAGEEQERDQVPQGVALATLAALEDSRAAAAARRPAEMLPYFPYAEAQGRESETLCAICVDPLRQGQHCSEVPACRHAFHRDCLAAWARTKGTCPLCRAKIEPGSHRAEVADDVV
ncbi:hypothetical protein PR202_ga17271 [Eleusine coracana subsp. coracana]|uniref:RING-type E3 ubiquitin transferase n=1 Tax=Eleusine coracana subsp. coracana TaxID=191504 RepID=A0AAV5CPP3_ELECO|nr:hypothetical protein QOZ80_6AG0516180 [Eleusine coracana subsp. coracana]GJN00110.1 hypothetical protein PR202_ga17271 [Eleusine coracana subsp. coracana]